MDAFLACLAAVPTRVLKPNFFVAGLLFRKEFHHLTLPLPRDDIQNMLHAHQQKGEQPAAIGQPADFLQLGVNA